MTQPPAETSLAAAAEAALPDVYVLSVDYRDGTTNIVRVSTDLDDLFNHYGPDSFSPTQPWQPVVTTVYPNVETRLWETRFATGNDGAHLWIRRMPLHGQPIPTDAAADNPALLDNYDPTPSLIARGIITDPTDPDSDHASSAFEAEQDRIVGEVWKWLNRHDAPWSPSDSKVSDLAYAIANGNPTFADDPEQTDHGKDRSTVRHPSLARMSDVEAFREDFFVNLPSISDGDLIALMNYHPHLLALAREYGWNETQVRDDFAAALEARGHTLD